MQAGYPRVHVARYTVLYTSLATRYEFHLDDPAAQILPFSGYDSKLAEEKSKNEKSLFESRRELLCRRGDDTQLTGFSVASNASDYIHSENMADFGGTVTLHEDSDRVLRVTNGTPHPLADCQALRRTRDGKKELAQVGALEPGATERLDFKPYNQPRKAPEVNPDAAPNPFPMEPDRPQKAGAENRPQGANPTGELSGEPIKQVALDELELRPDETCLLARIVNEVPGLAVSPGRGGQTRQAAILVAHLTSGRLPDPKADKNLAAAPSVPNTQFTIPNGENNDPFQ